MTKQEICELLDKLSDDDIHLLQKCLEDYISRRFSKEKKASQSRNLSSHKIMGTCPVCGSTHLIKWGKKDGKQRYHCKDCGATSTESTGTLVASSKIPEDVLLKIINCELRGDTLDEIHHETHKSAKTCFYIRQKLHEMAGVKVNESLLSGQFELDATYSKINLAGTRPEDMPRISKVRGTNQHIVGEFKSLTGPSHHKICIATAIDEMDNVAYKVVGLGYESENKYEKIANRIADGTLVISDNCSSIKNFAAHHGMKSDAIPTKPNAKFFTTPLGNSLGDVNELHAELKAITRKCHGISTRHLQGYLDWLSYRKKLKYTLDRELQPAQVLADLKEVMAKETVRQTCKTEQPISLKEAYGEYQYGTFSPENQG